jgi:hypothetical protein
MDVSTRNGYRGMDVEYGNHPYNATSQADSQETAAQNLLRTFEVFRFH